MTTTNTQPTPKQLKFLRVLCAQKGATFVAPNDVREASRQIKLLMSLKSCDAQDMRDASYEAKAISADMRSGATRVHSEEIVGFGADCQYVDGLAMASQEEGPTKKQVEFLAKLAARKGVEAPAVDTKTQASKAIQSLLAAK